MVNAVFTIVNWGTLGELTRVKRSMVDGTKIKCDELGEA